MISPLFVDRLGPSLPNLKRMPFLAGVKPWQAFSQDVKYIFQISNSPLFLNNIIYKSEAQESERTNKHRQI